MPTSILFLTSSLISFAMNFKIEFSIPKPFSPAKASPEKFLLKLFFSLAFFLLNQLEIILKIALKLANLN